jgi:hypothetical protein
LSDDYNKANLIVIFAIAYMIGAKMLSNLSTYASVMEATMHAPIVGADIRPQRCNTLKVDMRKHNNPWIDLPDFENGKRWGFVTRTPPTAAAESPRPTVRIPDNRRSVCDQMPPKYDASQNGKMHANNNSIGLVTIFESLSLLSKNGDMRVESAFVIPGETRLTRTSSRLRNIRRTTRPANAVNSTRMGSPIEGENNTTQTRWKYFLHVTIDLLDFIDLRIYGIGSNATKTIIQYKRQ